MLTFNRYIALRMIVEALGAISCGMAVLFGHTLVGTLITAVVALLWIIGEVWVILVLGRKNPRRDELSDQHQGDAMTFALLTLIGALFVIGFAMTLQPLITGIGYDVDPMALPALAMAALTVSDARYLWLERSSTKELSDNED